ncbi:MAG: metallophosphoesterase [Tissierella sp.]|uniref:metallophosphoesterase n=1 Tax=Tissierella sp. TaxID=41274 RepID=UPI003F988749
MRILVVSDTHGKNKKLIDKVKAIKKPDLIFHLGDYVGDGLTISKALEISPIIVMGNGDHPSSGFKEEEIIEIKGKRIFLTHGHRFGVYSNLNRLFYRAKELEADIALFGHTHIPIVKEMEGCILMNPGSPSSPRGFSHKKTFAIIEIDKEIKVKHIEID